MNAVMISLHIFLSLWLTVMPMVLEHENKHSSVTTEHQTGLTETDEMDLLTSSLSKSKLDDGNRVITLGTIILKDKSEKESQNQQSSLISDSKSFVKASPDTKQSSRHRNFKQTKDGKTKEVRHGRSHHRRRRRRRACKTKSEYVVLKEAIDIFGDTVKLAPLLEIEGVEIDQVFHESYCEIENCKCRGVDSSIYESSCETNHLYTLARVIKKKQIYWSHIKVRAGCSCVVREKRQKQEGNILDLI